jgi:hypothetical protein
MWLRVAAITGRTVKEAMHDIDSAEFSAWCEYLRWQDEQDAEKPRGRCPMMP